MKKVQPINRNQPLRILSDATRQNLADELARRKITRPELSINRLINDLIETALATTHTESNNVQA